MTAMTESAIAALIVLGALFVLLGSIGLARLPDFLTRLHGPTKATTLGVGALLLASAIFFSTREGGESVCTNWRSSSSCSSPHRLPRICSPRRRCTGRPRDLVMTHRRPSLVIPSENPSRDRRQLAASPDPCCWHFQQEGLRHP
jgi:hypothetical protein